MTAARVIETLEDTTPSRATERTSGVCIHPVQSPLTQRTSKQSGREDGAAQQDACLLRRISRISVGVAGSSVTLCAGRGGGDHRISPRSLDVGFSSDELTPCSASKGPLCSPLMDGSSRHRRWEVVSSFVMQCFPHGLLTSYQT